MKSQRFILAGLVAAMLPAATFAAQGKDEYPSRPVRMIVPFAPGGASDTVARIIQPAMADRLKQQVVVDNRGGAAGNIGVEVTVRANPDGYNFLLGNVGTMAINPVFYLKFQYKPLKDLIPVTQIVDVPGCLVVHPSLPAKNVKELIAHMKALLDKQFMTVVVNKSPEEFSAFVREEIRKWGKVASDNNITVE